MISEEIIKVLDYLGGKFGIVIDWTSENAMPYIQDLIHRIVAYNIWSCSLGVFIGVSLLIITILLIRHGNKKSNDRTACWDWEDEGDWLIVLCVLISVTGFVLTAFCLNGLLENIFIPEKSILQMVHGLL